MTLPEIGGGMLLAFFGLLIISVVWLLVLGLYDSFGWKGVGFMAGMLSWLAVAFYLIGHYK